MAVASFNFLSFNMESLRVAYHKAYKVKDLALCKLLEENFNFTGRLLAKVHKLKVGAISQRLDQPLHPKFTVLDDMRRLTFSSLAPPETSMTDVEIQTDENPPLIRFKTSCSQSTQCDPILPVPFAEPAYVSMQDRETQTLCKIKVIEVAFDDAVLRKSVWNVDDNCNNGDQVATSSGSIARKTRTMIPLEPDIIVVEPPPPEQNVVIDTPGPDVDVQVLEVEETQPSTSGMTNDEDDEDDEDDSVEIVAVTKREKRTCPVCDEPQSQLPRHLKRWHGWTSYDYKKHVMGEEAKSKNPLRKCPVKSCKFRSVRFDRHIPSVHKIKHGSDRYKQLMGKLRSKSLIKKHILIDTSRAEKAPTLTEVKKSQSQLQKTQPKQPTKGAAKDQQKEEVQPPIGSTKTKKRSLLPDMGDSDDEEYPVSIPKKQRLDESDVDTDDDVVDQEIDPEEEEESPNGSLGLTTSLEFGQSIKDFKEHLMRPDGGKKTEMQATIVARQIIKIATWMSQGKEPDALCGPWIEKDRIWSEFFEPNLKEYTSSYETGRETAIHKGLSPSTLQCYSMALEEFGNFLVTASNKWSKTLNEKDTNTLSCLAKCQKKWRICLRKDRRIQMNRRFVQDKQNKLTVQDIIKVLESQQAKDCAAKLKYLYQQVKEDKPVPVVAKEESRQLQAFLITKLLVENAGRSSLISNFSVKAADEITEEDGLYTAYITDHKTAASKGTAFLQMRRSGYRYIKAYQYVLRPAVETTKSDSTFFLNSAGTSLTSGMVSGYVISFVQEADVLSRGKTCPTDLRKMWVTDVYADGTPVERRQLSSKMSHSPRTAQIWYDLNEKQNEAAAGFKLIEKRLQDASGETAPQEESPVKSTAVKSKRIKKSWDKVEESAIVTAFIDEIRSENKPKIAIILEKFKKELPLIYNREDSKKYHERCFDKVRGLWVAHQKSEKKKMENQAR